MRETTLTGSYLEIGRQYGAQRTQLEFSPPQLAEKLAFMHASEPSVEEHLPNLLEELRGIADAVTHHLHTFHE